ncbi:MAG: hypothetical protein ACLRSW_10360 [Christensenellaceae bacterium]
MIFQAAGKYGDDKLTNPVMALPWESPPYYDPSISPEGLAHFWGEPLYGYYRSDDPWVVRAPRAVYERIDFLYLDYEQHHLRGGDEGSPRRFRKWWRRATKTCPRSSPC